MDWPVSGVPEIPRAPQQSAKRKRKSTNGGHRVSEDNKSQPGKTLALIEGTKTLLEILSAPFKIL